MAVPNIYQGTLNKLLASVIFASNPQLTIICSFLSPEGISIRFNGETSLLLPTTTGVVPSPQPYQIAEITANILKTNILGQLYKTQIETNTSVGSINVIPDTITLLPYQFTDCVIQSVQEMQFNGTTPTMAITLQGKYAINSAAFFGS